MKWLRPTTTDKKVIEQYARVGTDHKINALVNYTNQSLLYHAGFTQ